MKFAAFVMTYRRPAVAAKTIEALFKQTLPPEKVLVIDNDPEETAVKLTSLNGWPVEYVAVGYNAGPAGAAEKGLALLAEQGYDWISWIDDDDPPIFPDVYERLLRVAASSHLCGSVGIIGQQFHSSTGIINRFSDAQITGEGILEVDTIAGGMIKIINGKMIREKLILPAGKLFFGFEDLDIDLKIKKAGFCLLVDKELFLRHRTHYNRLSMEIKRSAKKPDERLWREYYSMRSLLHILWNNNYYTAFSATLLRALHKVVSNFRFGWSYGIKNGSYILKGVFDFLRGRYGKTI